MWNKIPPTVKEVIDLMTNIEGAELVKSGPRTYQVIGTNMHSDRQFQPVTIINMLYRDLLKPKEGAERTTYVTPGCKPPRNIRRSSLYEVYVLKEEEHAVT